MRIRPSTHGFYAKNYLFSTLLAVIMFFSGLYMAFTTGELLISAGLVVFGILLVIMGIAHSIVHRNATVLYLNENQLIYETGIFSHHKKIAHVSKITDSTIERTFFERIIGIGDLQVNTAGTGGIEILANDFNFEEVEKLHNRLNELMHEESQAQRHTLPEAQKDHEEKKE